MSSEQPLDPEWIEQTKRQIRSLVNEIAQFARSEMSAEEFYGEFLPRVVTALAAVGGVVWTLGDQGRLGLKYQVNLQASLLPQKSQEDQVRHGRMLQRVMATRETILVPPQSGFGEEEQGGNPTDFLLVLGPLKTELEVVGVVEIFQRPDTAPSTQKGYLRFLEQMCELAADFLKSRQLRHFSDRQVLWTQLEEFARLVHSSLNPRETAYTVANEGRRLIECDRVSVAIKKGNRCVIEAVSGQDMFDKRSNTVRLLNKLATVVVAAGEPIWYTGDTADMAPQVEDALQEYVDESHSKTVAVLPLRRAGPSEAEKEQPDEPQNVPPAVGALIVEQIEDSRVASSLYQRVDVVCRHSATAMANAMEHENLFLMPLWRSLGKSRWLIEARNLPKVLLALAALAVVVAVLAVFPTDFKLVSKGTLEPIVRRDVFPGIEATVEKVEVKHGDRVNEGTVLVRMRDPTLGSRLVEMQGNCLATLEAVNTLGRRLSNSRLNLTPEQQMQLTGERVELEAKLNSYEAQLAVLREQAKQLTVVSPIKGRVNSWDIDLKLQERRVRPDSLLVKVADPDGPFQLELQVPEDQLGHIAIAQNKLDAELRERLADAIGEQLREPVRQKLIAELRAATAGRAAPASAVVAGDDANPATAPAAGADGAASGDSTPSKPPAATAPEETSDAELERQVEAKLPERLSAAVEEASAKIPQRKLREKLSELTGTTVEDRLPVNFIIATDPGSSHRGWITEIHEYAEVHGEEGNTVLVKVAIDRDQIDPKDLRQGTSVSAKVICGRASLGYAWFHSVGAWFRKMWFRWF
jgi:multidrug efflux pump subunit AcrA (membrane-fusion protein)